MAVTLLVFRAVLVLGLRRLGAVALGLGRFLLGPSLALLVQLLVLGRQLRGARFGFLATASCSVDSQDDVC